MIGKNVMSKHVELKEEVYDVLEKFAMEANLSVTEYLNNFLLRYLGIKKIDKENRAIARNPDREPGQMSDLEREVMRIYLNKEPQKTEVFTTKVKQYWAPFNYPNFTVELGRPGSGAEVNTEGVELDVPPHGAITFTEEEPIIGVTVIGSACVPPGTVILHAEPIERKFPRTGVKMKVENLWGTHILAGPWHAGVDEGFREAGLSYAHFEIPESKKVTIMAHAGFDVDINPPDKPELLHRSPVARGVFWTDPHYTIRCIRVTVKVKEN